MKRKSSFKIPNTCALLFMLMMVAAVLTWIIPAGEYDTEKVGSVTRVIAGTYHTVERNPQGLWALFEAVPAGFYKTAKMLFSIMFIGGAVEVLEKSGSFSAMFSKITKKNLNIRVLVFFVMLFMTIGGAAGVFSNATIALIPIGITLALSLGYDSFSGFLMVYLGAFSGFNVGGAVSATLGVAQPIAELPIFSGMGVREIIHLINFIICYLFTIHYMESVRNTPARSLNYKEGMMISDYMGLKGGDSMNENHMTWRHALSLVGLLAAIAALLVGCVIAGWSHEQIAAIFFTLAVYLGLLNGMGVNGTAKAFLNGCSKMVNAAFITGFANGISVLMTNGRILNTIVYALSLPLNSLGSVLGANFMFIANLFINLFIPSGSGQAAAVMPIMVPLADLAGVTRQVAVQAFQFGDGLTNSIFPTSGTLMAGLAIAGVDWAHYARWFLRVIGCQVALAILSLTILQMIGWTGL
ncbi:YfcC family protein [Enterocloster bolteae]|uniref:YfcC family protein n=1 Tax=Enterocloster bolteae TaxID=208479 RepID=UPI002109D788|nr:Na+/H+ antiporter NhaC family protein [Enterocloster bolteae]MCQ5146054.1 AbgT family transporter [Enterocloster bolteae]